MPASLETLPTELIDLIIVQLTLDLVPADSYFRRDMAYRQSVLENVSLVNRRLNSIVTPHQSFFICTSRQAERVRKFSKQRCEQVRTVVFYLDQPNGIVGSEAIDTLAALSQVKHARFYGFGEIKYYGPAGPDHDGETLYWHTHLDIDLSEASPFSGASAPRRQPARAHLSLRQASTVSSLRTAGCALSIKIDRHTLP